MKRTFNFGKIAYTGKSKAYLVEVTVNLEERLKDGKPYYEFSACGAIWNPKHTDIVYL